MADVTPLKTITTTGTGASDFFYLPARDGGYTLDIVWAGSPGDADLQSRGGATMIDVTDADGVVNITGNIPVWVPGGRYYGLDVNTHTSAATMTAHEA